jgi:hypothetical protein
MIKKIKLMLLSMSYMFALLLPFGMAAPAYAALTPSETHDNLCKGSNLDLSAAAANCPANTGTSVTDLIKKIINILSVLIGAIAVVMIILGGFRYVTSAGKQESVTAAKNTILYAIIGLVIVALAQVIVHFVLNNVNPS